MVRPGAWVLNLDAEDELARPAGYTPARAMEARIASLAPRLRALWGEDVLLAEGVDARGRVGRAWCPTPRAVRAWQRAGCEIPAVPAVSVLQRVNGRGFCAALGQQLPGACYVRARSELEAVIAGAAVSGEWLLKREFGYAGRGRRKVHAGGLSAHDAAWVEASLREGGLQAEPWVARAGDYALHGWISEAGAVVWGEPTSQRVDEKGAWVESVIAPAGELSGEESRALRSASEEAARALSAAGYWGAFGVDAYRWRDERGETRFNARSEINARYSMGWAVGMNGRRPDRE